MKFLAALLLWLALAVPALAQVGNPNLINVRDYGARGDGTTDDHAAFQAAVAVANTKQACVYVPYSTHGYKLSAAISYTTSSKDQCLTGDPLNTAQNFPTTQKSLLLTTDTDCVDNNGTRVSVYNISCKGNGDTSSSSADTVCIHYTLGGYDSRVTDVSCTGYVEGLRPTERMRITNFTVDNSGLYPNLTNDFPSYCVHNTDPSFNVEVVNVKGLFCRDQGTVTLVEFTGDGATTYYDFHVAAGSGRANQANVIWASDSIQACQAMGTGSRYPCVPLVPGTDFTLYDCGASACGGSGGTLLPVTVLKTATVASNPQVTVSSTTGLTAGTAYKVWAEHNLKEPTYVVSVDDSTHVTLSNAPTSTNSAVKYTFYKVNLSAGSCGLGTSPTCGYNLEVRFTSAPPTGINVEIQHNDPWSYVGIYDENGTEGQYDVLMMGGIRNIISTGGVGTYGETHVNVDYWEIGNYCMTVDEGAASGYFNAATSTVVDVRRNVRPPTILGTNRRCPIWVPPTGYGNRLVFNGSSWRQYEGTTTIGTVAGGISWTMGSDTAPISSTAGQLEIRLSGITCNGTSNLNFQASEDGTTFLASTSYTYALSNNTPASGAYVTANSTGANSIQLSANNLDTSGAYMADITVGAPGLAVAHPVKVNVNMTDSGGTARSLVGVGQINGTPAALKAIRVSCGTGGTEPLLGQLWYRELWN